MAKKGSNDEGQMTNEEGRGVTNDKGTIDEK